MNLKGREHYQAQRRAAWERDGGKCVVCGRTAESTHHRQGRGGPDPHRLAGILTVCGDGVRGCHGDIHASPSAAYALGRMVPRLGIRTVEDTPVSTRHGWVVLGNDGSVTPAHGDNPYSTTTAGSPRRARQEKI